MDGTCGNINPGITLHYCTSYDKHATSERAKRAVRIHMTSMRLRGHAIVLVDAHALHAAVGAEVLLRFRRAVPRRPVPDKQPPEAEIARPAAI